MERKLIAASFGFAIACALAASCDDDPEFTDGPTTTTGSGVIDQTGDSCVTPNDCYPHVSHADLKGEVQCLDRVEDGYCTHLCTADEDCCAVQGECPVDHPEVCAPFESTGMMMCFVSCEAADVGTRDENDYCREFADDEFICRSTGGGSQNRKVCVPGGGGSCTVVEDCSATFPHCCFNDIGTIRYCYDDVEAAGRDCLP